MIRQYCIVLCVLSLFGISTSVSAQMKVGVKGGGNVYDNYQTGTKYFTSEPAFGFHLGAFGDYVIKENISVGVEALFNTRGLNTSEVVQGSRVNFERQSSYVDFPLSVNYTVIPSLKVHAGVIPSLFIEEFRSITTVQDGFKVDEGDTFHSYKRWQLGAMAGVGYDLTLFDKNFEIGARYSMGFTRTHQLIRDVRASRDPKYMMLQLYVAYPLFTF